MLLLFLRMVTSLCSRIYNGVHYPGDVIVGAALGMLIGWGMSKLYKYIEFKHFSKHHEIGEI